MIVSQFRFFVHLRERRFPLRRCWIPTTIETCASDSLVLWVPLLSSTFRKPRTKRECRAERERQRETERERERERKRNGETEYECMCLSEPRGRERTRTRERGWGRYRKRPLILKAHHGPTVLPARFTMHHTTPNRQVRTTLSQCRHNANKPVHSVATDNHCLYQCRPPWPTRLRSFLRHTSHTGGCPMMSYSKNKGLCRIMALKTIILVKDSVERSSIPSSPTLRTRTATRTTTRRGVAIGERQRSKTMKLLPSR